MQRDVRKYLLDIVIYSEMLAGIVLGKTLADYLGDLVLRLAVERLLITVGEAVSRAVALRPELRDEVPATRMIIPFRNRLVHGYDTLANDLLWQIIQEDLPVLRQHALALLRELDPQAPV